MAFEHRSGQGGGSVNATTDWDDIPACALAGVMREVLQRVLGLRAKYGDGARILIQKVDVKNAFRQIPVDPNGGLWIRAGWIPHCRFAFAVRVEGQSGVGGRDIGGDAACAA